MKLQSERPGIPAIGERAKARRATGGFAPKLCLSYVNSLNARSKLNGSAGGEARWRSTTTVLKHQGYLETLPLGQNLAPHCVETP